MSKIARPDFFIVGAPKCGTTAMHSYLSAHPGIFMAHKEMHFFGSDLKIYRIRVTSLEDYLAHFAEWNGERRIGEASVLYLSSKTSAAEIHAFAPDAQIIIMLRHPVEMIYSLYSQMRYTGNEDIPDFEAALAAEADRKLSKRLSKKIRYQSGLYYREIAQYTDQVRRYFDIFGRDRVHVIIYDDFKRDTQQVYQRTLEFLGVAPDFRPEFEIVNANKRSRSRWLRNLMVVPPQWYLSLLPLGRKLFSGKLRDRVNRFIKQRNTVFVERQRMDSDLRCRLQAEFRPEIERLSELLNIDLTHWSQ
jgi:hypothetical protein